MEKKRSELTVITKAKDLCGYVMTVTQKSRKHYRYTFVSRLQNLSMDILENLFRANDVFAVKGDYSSIARRRDFQQQAMTDLKLLAYFAQLAFEQKCILANQFEQISMQSADCQNLFMYNRRYRRQRNRFPS